jgi:hypothetical protein
MPNYTLTDAGLVTSDPVIAAMFLGEEICDDCQLAWIWYNQYGNRGFTIADREWHETDAEQITIPRSLVKAAIQAVEGEGYVTDHIEFSDEKPLIVYTDLPHISEQDAFSYYHKRVLNIVTTRTELRELVSRCKEVRK